MRTDNGTTQCVADIERDASGTDVCERDRRQDTGEKFECAANHRPLGSKKAGETGAIEARQTRNDDIADGQRNRSNRQCP